MKVKYAEHFSETVTNMIKVSNDITIEALQQGVIVKTVIVLLYGLLLP